MTTTNTFIGIGEAQRISSRVLKPPGGGSSIAFGEDDDFSGKTKAQTAPAAAASPQTETPKNDTQEQQQSPTPAANAETNGTTTPPQTPKDNESSTATKENNPSTATSPVNGVAVNGTMTNGTHTSGSSTPNSSRLDTQNRLFGDEPRKETPSRRIRDHHRSNIFTEADSRSVATKPVYRRPWSRRDPVTGEGVLCWDLHAPRFAPIKRKANSTTSGTPEPKTPEEKGSDQSKPQIQPSQRQRVPPGGFSTKLW